jgi:polyribonucleotide nucleotidyltransferase
MSNVTNVAGQFAGTELSFETGKLAQLATGSALARYGDTVVLATAVVGGEKPGFDYFPLNVNYEEKMYATGKISGGFFKREARPSEDAILISRLIDRPIRPLFPKGARNDVQIICTVLSADKAHHPDIVAMNAASAALMAAGAPIAEPMGAVRIGKVDGQLVVNPTEEQRETSDLDLVVAATESKIMMVEAGANEIPEQEMLKAFELAMRSVKESLSLQRDFAAKVNPTQVEAAIASPDEKLVAEVQEKVAAKLSEAFRDADKQAREKKVAELEGWLVEELIPQERGEKIDEGELPYTRSQIIEAFDSVMKKELRRAILEDEARPDGRGIDEIRPISCEVGVLPRTHGSALFTRGQTQGLSITTLGTPGDEQVVDTMLLDTKKRYMHHYNFPPYSTGEARPLRGPGRREIGHGALAERALVPVIPEKEDFPYTMRLVTEILSSNGSSSMASVCGSTLSLMDAGVPIKKPVSGIAMGLVTDGEITKVLTDIQGAEDFAGDMDFKVAGTADGITALQMDMKVQGIPLDVMQEALDKAKNARLFILEKMLAAISEPRHEMSPLAPRITTIKINPDMIRVVIGPGGKMINEIIAATGVSIDIEDDGTVMIGSVDGDGAKKAIDWIGSLTAEPEIGKEYDAKVVKIMAFGAFVEFMPGKEGLVHVSQIADRRIENVADVLKEGQQVKVKLLEIDPQGRNNLSMKAVDGNQI